MIEENRKNIAQKNPRIWFKWKNILSSKCLQGPSFKVPHLTDPRDLLWSLPVYERHVNTCRTHCLLFDS